MRKRELVDYILHDVNRGKPPSLRVTRTQVIEILAHEHEEIMSRTSRGEVVRLDGFCTFFPSISFGRRNGPSCIKLAVYVRRSKAWDQRWLAVRGRLSTNIDINKVESVRETNAEVRVRGCLDSIMDKEAEAADDEVPPMQQVDVQRTDTKLHTARELLPVLPEPGTGEPSDLSNTWIRTIRIAGGGK